jgi:hypothetical protein
LRTQSDEHITIYFISRYDAIKNPTADLATHLETGTHKNMKSAKTAVTGAPKFDLTAEYFCANLHFGLNVDKLQNDLTRTASPFDP